MIKTFEQYLEEVAPSGVHTNNSPEGFERWLENLDISKIMEYAEDYGIEIYKKAFIDGSINAVNSANRLASNIN